jgi:Caspase domain
MPSSPVTRQAPELPDEHRFALVIATSEYTDPELRQLRSPGKDAEAFRDVLADKNIAGFEVTSVVNKSSQEIRLAIHSFLSDRDVDDVLLVYVTCHGLLDDYRRLYFAATDTQKKHLAATAFHSRDLAERMEECRARRQVLILDCCFSGAFVWNAKGDTELDLKGRFQGGGRGKVFLAASRSTEYSYEGKPLHDGADATSIFTSALIDGLKSGAADNDGDGFIYVPDAYYYAFDRMREANAPQIPQIDNAGEGRGVLLARNPIGMQITPAVMPESIAGPLNNNFPAVRLGAVRALAGWLSDADIGRRIAAVDALQDVVKNDIPEVANVARELLDASSRERLPISVRLDPPTVLAEDESADDISIVVDNSGGDSDVDVVLEAHPSDAELQITFQDNPITVRAGAVATTLAHLAAPSPALGSEVIREFDVVASDGVTMAKASGSLIQSTTQAPPTMRLDPAGGDGNFDVIVDNSHSVTNLRLTLAKSRPDDSMRYEFTPKVLMVAARRVGRAQLTVSADPPAEGQAVRRIDVTAAGEQTFRAQAEFVQHATEIQVASAPAPRPDAATPSPVRGADFTVVLDPSKIVMPGMTDTEVHVHVKNRRSTQPIQVRLSGSDPDGRMAFTFEHPSLQIAPGATASSRLTVSAPLPEAGTRKQHQIIVAATAGDLTALGKADVVQTTSPAPAAAAQLELAPAELKVHNKNKGHFTVVVDNSRGTQPLQVGLAATAPGHAVGFSFKPRTLSVPAGGSARSQLKVTSTHAPNGKSVAKPIHITAGQMTTAGTWTQVSSAHRSVSAVLVSLIVIALTVLAIAAAAVGLGL